MRVADIGTLEGQSMDIRVHRWPVPHKRSPTENDKSKFLACENQQFLSPENVNNF